MRYILIIHFLFYFYGNANANANSVQGKQFLSGIDPQVKKVWDRGVIVLADKLLKKNDKFNTKLSVTVELMFTAQGTLAKINTVASSGYEPFDFTAIDAMKSIKNFNKPGTSLISDDGYVHVFWTLNRNKPYSPMTTAEIRYVRWKPERAIKSYISSGLFSKAIEKLLSTREGQNISKSASVAFIKTYLEKKQTEFESASFISEISRYLNFSGFDATVFSGYFSNMSTNEKRIFLKKTSSEGLCSTLRDLVAESDIIPVITTLYLRKYSCKDTSVLKKALSYCAGTSSFLKVIEKGFSGKALNSSDIALFEKFVLSDKRELDYPVSKSGFNELVPFYARILRGKYSISIKKSVISALSHSTAADSGKLLLEAIRRREGELKKTGIVNLKNYHGNDARIIFRNASWEYDTLIKKTNDLSIKGLAVRSIIEIAQSRLDNPNFKHYYNILLRNANEHTLLSAVSGLNPENSESKKRLVLFLKNPNAKVRQLALKLLLSISNDAEIEKEIKSLNPKLFPDFIDYINARKLSSSELKSLSKTSNFKGFLYTWAWGRSEPSAFLNDFKKLFSKNDTGKDAFPFLFAILSVSK
ncbi:energy transducer TonB [Myxococcota bacterium]|nr:energy transducer TonB [Myxococcota bacterium]MBU1379792.1 energy transducer TonB [Myxococcota bacterium]MBU1497593.1 energy transducer TonB [Myxococcota bacterium]